VEKIAGIAAREVPGIHAPGGGFSRTMGAMRDARCGVEVEVGEKQTAIDLEVVVECTARRASPTSMRLVGLKTASVDVSVAWTAKAMTIAAAVHVMHSASVRLAPGLF
jgi:hypothetical protein